MRTRTTGAAAVLALVGSGFAVATTPAQATGELCQGQPVTISATARGQEIAGTDGADVISTAGFNQVVVLASAGDDVVCATTGRNALLLGGPGADSFAGGPTTKLSYYYSESGVQIDLAAGTVVDGGETDTVSGIHTLTGSLWADTFVGGPGDDSYSSSGDHSATYDNDDDVRTGGGDDLVHIERGGTVDLGPGDDTALVADGTIDGGTGDDVIAVVMSGAANGGPGRDVLSATVDAEDTRAPSEGDRFELNGDGGRDLIYQPSGVLQGGYRCPTICGRADVDGGTGRDTLSVRERGVVDLAAGRARTPRGRSHLISVENVVGSPRDDVIRGDSAANRLVGGGGNDVLLGRGGRDTAFGGPGRDRCGAEVRRSC